MEKKNKARKRMIQRETRNNAERYRQLRAEANKICRRKKKQMNEEKMKQIEELNGKKETRKFYRRVSRMNKTFQARVDGCKNKAGKVIREKKDIIDRWTEHFKELLNKEQSQDKKKEAEESQMKEIEEEEEIEEPTKQEVIETIK